VNERGIHERDGDSVVSSKNDCRRGLPSTLGAVHLDLAAATKLPEQQRSAKWAGLAAADFCSRFLPLPFQILAPTPSSSPDAQVPSVTSRTERCVCCRPRLIVPSLTQELSLPSLEQSQTVKAISGVHTVRFKNELERNITIKLGYANAKVRTTSPRFPLPMRRATADESRLRRSTSARTPSASDQARTGRTVQTRRMSRLARFPVAAAR
jgi:hypothetical protein